ncbi:cytochrome P450 [Plantactinospora sonchi]|uniref:Cytochrome P450 n=1 Tax=Plantactinospora sonchi TaxID=1544735 RepID=A0ABU7S359_9ACTN
MELRPFAGAYLTDPGAVWRDLLHRDQGVHYADDLGMWLISRHEHVRQAFGDPESFGNALTLAPVYEMCPEALAVVMRLDVPPTTAAADSPVHTRTRAALRATFANTAGRVSVQYGPIVRRRVDELVDGIARRRGEVVDLIPEFTALLPLLVVVDILGVPDRDVPRIRSWADGQIALIWGRPEPAEQVRLARGLLDFWHYCQDLVARRVDEGATGDDFVSRVLRHRDGDDGVLTEAEVASMAFNLLVAGHETTAGLLAHALEQALATPERWRRLAEEPEAVPGFLEETLRFGPAIDGWLRVTRRPVAVGGVTIPAGARCLLLIGAANRDPAVFADPQRFDPDRVTARDHLSFGYGPHFCIGAALARLEARIALGRLAEAIPALRLAAGHVTAYKPNVAFRAHQILPAVVDTGTVPWERSDDPAGTSARAA